MALELSTLNLWLIIGIFAIFLFTFISVLFFCARCLKTRRKNAQLYTIEDVGFKNRNSFNFYRKFSSTANGDVNLLKDESPNGDGILVDSMDASNKFTNSLLRLNSQVDEMRSCISTDSLGTFYSTNFSRNNSKRSFVSCSEGSHDGDMV